MIRIVIADDHPVVRHGLRQILSADPGIEVVGEAKDGIEARRVLRTVEWDVAVLDYSMPGHNGLEILTEMKRDFPKRPVLILSMHPEELHATRVLKAGAAGYLNKESAGDQLTAAVRKVMAGGKYVSAALAEKLAFDLTQESGKPLHESLSDREYRVMWLLASGKQATEIAKELFLSPSTVSTYRARILEKLQLSNNAEIVQYAVKHRLIE